MMLNFAVPQGHEPIARSGAGKRIGRYMWPSFVFIVILPVGSNRRYFLRNQVGRRPVGRIDFAVPCLGGHTAVY